MGFFETLMNKEPYHIVSYPHSFPVFANHLCRKRYIGGKGRIGQIIVFFSFQSFLIRELKSELVECLHLKREIKPVEYILFDVFITQVRTEYLCMYDRGNRNCVILVILQIN